MRMRLGLISGMLTRVGLPTIGVYESTCPTDLISKSGVLFVRSGFLFNFNVVDVPLALNVSFQCVSKIKRDVYYTCSFSWAGRAISRESCDCTNHNESGR